jgi:ATP-binding cassette subfamily B protein/subfamily B ATP-binding cassette protein MsbA
LGGVLLGVDRSRYRHRSFGQLFSAFWALIQGHRAITLVSMGALTVAVLIGLAPIYGTKIIFDNVLREHPLPVNFPVPLPHDPYILLATVSIIMILLTVVSQVFTVWSRWQATRAGKRVSDSVRKRVFDHAVRLPLHRVYDLKSGGVASILREDAGGVGELLFSMMYNPWRAVVQIFGCLIVLAWVDWRLLLGSALLLPIVYFTHKTWISRIRPIFRDIRATRQQIDAHATESFGGMRIVRSFSRERSESGAFTNHNHLMIRQELLAWWWARGIDVAWSILIPLATACLLWYGGIRILHDEAAIKAGTMAQGHALTIGDLVMFMSYLASLLGPIATLANSATALQNNLAGLDRVMDLLGEPIEMPPAPDAVAIDRDTVEGSITLRNVAFTYAQSARPVLEGINLEVRPGEMIALVGPSGAGKTTFCNLIARFYDPTSGEIRLDGIDLRKITLDSYRRLLGIVEQDTFLFDGTIAQNIAYGRRHATRAQIAHAARLAHADEFIEKVEGGYDALIGERGVKLSGGQRQRITIARAILADPKILILDEATSNLDTESERLIQARLYNLMAGRTSFVIAHRLSTIAHADRILVVENGRIIEQGRHDELMAASGRYRSMVEMQTNPPASPMIRQAVEPVAEEEAV